MTILRAMGMTQKSIRHTFFLLGMLIILFGGGIGIFISCVVILIQQSNPCIYVPGTSLPYPVIWEFENLILVTTTLIFLGSVASAWASRGAKY